MSKKLTYMSRQLLKVVFLLATLLSLPTLYAQETSDQSTSEVTTQEDNGVYTTDAGVVAAGEALFKANCLQCHQVHKKVIGPALAGVTDRLEIEWLIPWIKNSQKVIASGDEYANQIYEQYNKTQMQAFNLPDEDILSILSYVKVESDKCPDPTNPDCPDYVDPSSAQGDEAVSGGSGVDSAYLTAIMIIVIVVLIIVLIALIMIVKVLRNYIQDKENLDPADAEIVSQSVDIKAFLKSNAFLGIIVFLFTAIALKTLIDGAFTIGVQQGYQPTQPINFSHEIHAGQYEIDCNYCHTGVRKAKSANIPSANICMNCHREIKKDSKEIQKIYAAIDYNPETQEYGTNTRPIEWIRIHNLPDLVYFNHSQHVAVAGLECQECHGPVEEMSVVYQYSNLTMGWCINCHRETEVNTNDNAYYDKLVKLHKEKSKEPMKVEDIGGLECSKCHY